MTWASVMAAGASAAGGASASGGLMAGIGGGLLGGLLGGKGSQAQNVPQPYEGHLTESQRQTQNTTQQGLTGLPQWQLDLIQPALRQGAGMLGGAPRLPQFSGLMQPSVDQLNATMRGDYLSPDSNPFLKQGAEQISQGIQGNVGSLFSGAGRYGSGAHQETLGRTTGDALAKYYGDAYGAERGRQMQAAQFAPSFTQSDIGLANAQAQLPWLNLQNFMGMAGGNFGQTSQTAGTAASDLSRQQDTHGIGTQTNFTNPAGNILGGALIGSQLFGGLGGRGGGAVMPQGTPWGYNE